MPSHTELGIDLSGILVKTRSVLLHRLNNRVLDDLDMGGALVFVFVLGGLHLLVSSVMAAKARVAPACLPSICPCILARYRYIAWGLGPICMGQPWPAGRTMMNIVHGPWLTLIPPLRLPSLLQMGKIHFGVILGWSVVHSSVLWLIVNQLAGAEAAEAKGLDLYSICCVVGYCMVPLVVYSAVSLLIPR